MAITIIAFYRFFSLSKDALDHARNALTAAGQESGLGGLILLSEEGINGTIAGAADSIGQYKKALAEIAGELEYKESYAESQPFKRFCVKIRREIVAIGDPAMHPSEARDSSHVSPEEWDRMMAQENTVVIDTRNEYETAIGMFEGAVDPHLTTFQEFPEYVKSANIPKDATVMLYCTGGIRCEKAVLAMKREGYRNVYQLRGGILKYLEERKGNAFRGECFVFDHRVAVNADLQPSSRYTLCPHCGDPGDIRIACERCGKEAKTCARCSRTCSKDCAYHINRIRGKATATAS